MSDIYVRIIRPLKAQAQTALNLLINTKTRAWSTRKTADNTCDDVIYHVRQKVSIVGSLCDREVACSASDSQGSNFESCVWRTVSSQSSHHPQEVLLAQFSLYVHKGGLKPDSFHFIFYLCYKFEFVDYANIFVFDWPWKFIRGWSLNIHPWMKVHPWMGSAYSSVDESSSVDGECVFIRGLIPIRGLDDLTHFIRG